MNIGLVAVVNAAVFTAIVVLTVVLRCLSRFVILQKAGSDDILAILALLCSVALMYTFFKQHRYGLGRDITQVRPHDLLMMFRYFAAACHLYGAGMTFMKISALFQYLRFLFEPATRRICWVLIIACGLFGIAATFVNIFQCRPVEFIWNKTIPGGKCINLVAWWYFAAAWTIVTDIIVVAIPIVAIKDITIPRSQKFALIIVFALGGGGCALSIVRLRSIYVAATSLNPTVDNAEVLLWSAIELNIGITCISIPPLKALIGAISTRWTKYKQKKNYSPDHRVLEPQDLCSFGSDTTIEKGESEPLAVA